MNFDHTYFKEEVREGYYIPGIMKRFWAAQLEVLKDVDAVCQKNGIKWYAAYGTLLGAVRHKGFIPWDDDIDICMLRDDYEKFFSLAQNELASNYRLKYDFAENEDVLPLGRVYNTEKISLDKDFLLKYHGYPMLAGIDIFAVDNVSDDPLMEKKRIDDYVREFSALENDIKNGKKDLVEMRMAKLKDISTRFNDTSTKKIGVIPAIASGSGETSFSRNGFETMESLPFETGSINVPCGYDECLTSLYGDYMKVIKNGGDHNYPAYDKNESIFINALEGGSPFEYAFKESDFVSSNREDFSKVMSLYIKYRQIIGGLHERIVAENIRTSEFTSYLVTLQNMAVNIGESVEKFLGEQAKMVKSLENVCEALYELYLFSVGEKNDVNACINRIKESIENMDSFIADREQKKKALFVVYDPRDWKYIEKKYDECKKEEKDVKIVVVPYYERNMDGTLGAEHFDIEHFDKNLNVVSYAEYDIKSEHPDIIYTQYGYDTCNQTTCISLAYFTSVLRDYTEELIYVPPYEVDENDNSEKMNKMMRYYVPIPGIVYSDRVIVQSETMARRYVKYLCEFYGSKYENIWKNKIIW